MPKKKKKSQADAFDDFINLALSDEAQVKFAQEMANRMPDDLFDFAQARIQGDEDYQKLFAIGVMRLIEDYDFGFETRINLSANAAILCLYFGAHCYAQALIDYEIKLTKDE